MQSKILVFLAALFLIPSFADATPPAGQKPTIRETAKAAWGQFQVYRGKFLERVSDRMVMGRPNFNRKLSVKENLKALVKEKGMNHFYKQIDGRDVLHVVVELGKGKESKRQIRDVFKRIGKQTVEMNYKLPSKSNPYGHVAVRAGDGALYDMTGTRGVVPLPPVVEKMLKLVRGHSSISTARKRSERRFLESRSGDQSSSVYYGMLYAAKPKEISSLASLYDARRKTITEFKVGGGDASKGEYSCAQFLTENVPYMNKRGVNGTISAKATERMSKASKDLQAVVVYKMPGASLDSLK